MDEAIAGWHERGCNGERRAARTIWRGDETCVRVNLDGRDAVGARELCAAEFGPERDCLLHELLPDWKRTRRAGQTQLCVVVKTDPDDADQVWRVTREPTIARCAGIAGDGRLSFKSARSPRCAFINHVGERVCDHVCGRGANDLLRGGSFV